MAFGIITQFERTLFSSSIDSKAGRAGDILTGHVTGEQTTPGPQSQGQTPPPVSSPEDLQKAPQPETSGLCEEIINLWKDSLNTVF